MPRNRRNRGQDQSTEKLNQRRQDIVERQTERTEEYRGTRRIQGYQGRQRVNGRTINTLDNLLQDKSDAINFQYDSIAQINDPVARKLLRQMVRDEQNNELRLAKVIDYLEGDPGSISKLFKQLELSLGSNRAKGFTTGLITALVVAALLPGAQKNLRPLLLSLVKGFNDVSEKTKDLLAGVKESVEDVVAQAQFEMLQDNIDKDVSGALSDAEQ